MRNFVLTTNHIKLLRAAYVSWEDCEFGAPSIDCKRPYGNSSVIQDMAKILEREDLLGDPESDDYISQEVEEKFTKLHKQTQTALQIILTTGKMEPGHYRADDYRNNWQKVEEII